MYSTKLENHRYEVECVAVSNVIKIPILIVDTGALYSCCHYMDIDERLKESELQVLETKYLGGFVRGRAIKFYKYPLRQFTVGNIDKGARFIWITFDDRITDKVLGMDILKDMTFLNKDKKLYFYDGDENVGSTC